MQRQFYFPHGGKRQRPRRRLCHDSASPQPCLRNSLQDAFYSHNTKYKPNLHVMWLVSWDPHLIFGLKLMNCVLSLEFADKKIITGRITSYCCVESRNWLHSAWLMVSCASLLPRFLISFISFLSFQSLFLYLPNHCFVQLPSSSPLPPPLSSSSSHSLSLWHIAALSGQLNGLPAVLFSFLWTMLIEEAIGSSLSVTHKAACWWQTHSHTIRNHNYSSSLDSI